MSKGILLSLSLLFVSSVANAEGVTIFKTPPADFNQKLQIGACFLKAGEDFLFLHRLPSSSNGNLWGIPGGKIDKGEAAIDGVVREVFEETGFQITDKTKMKNLGKVYIRQHLPPKDFVYHMYEYILQDKFLVKLSPTEHKGFTWMTLRDSLDYKLIHGEEECIDIAYQVSKTPALSTNP